MQQGNVLIRLIRKCIIKLNWRLKAMALTFWSASFCFDEIKMIRIVCLLLLFLIFAFWSSTYNLFTIYCSKIWILNIFFSALRFCSGLNCVSLALLSQHVGTHSSMSTSHKIWIYYYFYFFVFLAVSFADKNHSLQSDILNLRPIKASFCLMRIDISEGFSYKYTSVDQSLTCGPDLSSAAHYSH